MSSEYYFNPYMGQTFFGFFIQLAIRLWTFVKGDLSPEQLASDEIQIIVIAGVAISSALLGTFLILRKMTMLANSLSHTILIGIVVAFLWTHSSGADSHHVQINIEAMLIASLIMGVVTAFLTELLTKSVRLQEDASTGLVFTSLFAIGVVALTIATRNAHIGTEVVMGNADALQWQDCKLVYAILGINVVLIVLFFKEFQLSTFDAGLSRALGISPLFFSYLLMTQVSATAIGAFRAVGVLMVLTMITGPALTARLLTHNLRTMLVTAAAIGCAAAVIGIALSRHLLTVYDAALSTGGIVVCTIILIYIATCIMVKLLDKFATKTREKQKKKQNSIA